MNLLNVVGITIIFGNVTSEILARTFLFALFNRAFFLHKSHFLILVGPVCDRQNGDSQNDTTQSHLILQVKFSTAVGFTGKWDLG